MRALVTGCAGFIGSHLTEALLARGDSVVGLDCFNDNYGRSQKLSNLRGAQEWDRFDFVPVDLARGDLGELTADSEVVFHMAAEPGVRAGWGPGYERYVRNNITATQHLLEALKARGDARLVFASSSSVYGNAPVRPTPETVRLQPHSPYGQTKLSAEHLCAIYGANYGLDIRSLRYFTVYGPRQRPDMALHDFCRAALEDSRIMVFGDGSQTRDFTYVDDAVAATIAAAELEQPGEREFNVGGGEPTSIRTALDLIRELAGHPLRVDNVPAMAGDVQDTAADTTRARRWLAYDPATSFADGLSAQFAWLKRDSAGARSRSRAAS